MSFSRTMEPFPYLRLLKKQHVHTQERVTGRAMRAKIRELSSGRRAAPDTRAYQQRLRPAGRASGGGSPSSPSLGRRGGIGSASSLGQTRGVSRLRRGGSGSDSAGGGLADSSSTNRRFAAFFKRVCFFFSFSFLRSFLGGVG